MTGLTAEVDMRRSNDVPSCLLTVLLTLGALPSPAAESAPSPPDDRADSFKATPRYRVDVLPGSWSRVIKAINDGGEVLVTNTISFIEPASTFNLNYAVGALASPMIGGTAHWLGPVIGAVLLSSLQQIVTVTVSNELNVLVVGVLLVVFIVAAPEGILGLFKRLFKRP